MPLAFGASIVEGKVYRGRRRKDDDDEKDAMRELQTILNTKNRRPCNCEAQVHDLLENCLSCGRLACISEGPGKCLSCGNIVLNQDQRERLAKHIDILQPLPNHSNSSSKPTGNAMTKIIDDQFDHFAIDNKKHLREEDKRRLKEELESIQAKRYQRKLMLDINVDQLEAGARSVPQLDDYEAALRNLQLNHQTTESNSSLTLAELVDKEAKYNYNFDYIEHNDVKKKQVIINAGGEKVKAIDKPQKQPKYKRQQPKNKPPNQRQRASNNKPTDKKAQEARTPSAWNKSGN